MINLLIFSKDRAAQLDLLLRSLQCNCPSLFSPTVIMKWSYNEDHSSDFADGYTKLIRKGFPNVTWRVESTIKQDLLDFLHSNPIFAISTDDCVFYRRMDDSPEYIQSLLDDEVACVSFRMGLNNTIQDYSTGEKQLPVEMYEKLDIETRFNLEGTGDITQWIKFYWKSYPVHSNCSYWMGQDFHMFRSEDWLKMLQNFEFENMRQVESMMVHKRRDMMRRIYGESG